MPQLVRVERADAPARRGRHALYRVWRAVRGISVVKTAAGDLRTDSLRAGRRFVRGVQYRREELVHEAAHRVRRHPFRAVGLALAAGSALGMTAMLIGRRH